MLIPTFLVAAAILQASAPPAMKLHATTASAITAIRARLVNEIWGAEGFPRRLAQETTTGVSPALLESPTPLVNLRQVDRYLVVTDGNAVLPMVLRPTTPNGKLLMVGLGHSTAGTLAQSAVTAQLVNLALERGATVLFTPMPLGGTPAHDALGTHRTSTFNPVRYFLDPAIVALNTYLSQNPAPAEIIAAGVSGGGWATVLLAALDPRIEKSFPIAGSLPLGLRDPNRPSDYGDWEQRLTGLSVDGHTQLDYPDLYLMATSDGRTQVQVNNDADTCCFYGTRQIAYAAQLRALTSNWSFVQESAPGLHGATIATMTTVIGETLAAVVAPSVDRVIDDSGSGFVVTGPDWVHRVEETGAWGGDIHHTAPQCAGGGTGLNVATWTFSDVPDGEVEIGLTWTAFENRATNAPVEILDGADQILLSLRLDQRQPPVGIAMGGKVFQVIGRPHVRGGAVKVRLTDDADGCVIADAAMLRLAPLSR